MASYTPTTAGPILKEKFDPAIADATSKRNTTFSWFRRKVDQKDVNDRNYFFAMKTQRNQGYGSLTGSQSGGLLPVPGALSRRKIQADYRDHFVSGEIDGRIQDAKSDAALLNMAKDAIMDAEESFTTFQDLYLFGNGQGVLGVVTGISGTNITFALSQTNPYGSMMLQPGQRCFFHNASTFVQYTGTIGTAACTVSSVTSSTDVVAFDQVPSDLATGALVVIESTFGRETQGFDYHAGNFGTTWLADGQTGTAITRSTAPWSNANVIDKSAAALTPDMIDQAALQTSDQIGDDEVDYGQVLISHEYQQNAYRKLGYSLNRTVNVTGNPKLDLGFGKVSHNGMEWRTSAHCPADRIYGLRLEDWVMPEVVAPQMKDFQHGPLIQKPGTDRYYDAAQFAVYARYNVVCKRPFTQFLLKNLQIVAADVRRRVF